MKYTSLNDFLHKCGGHCYIYGGGVWGYYVLKYIFTKVENITVDAILVSDFKKNSDNIFGIPIKIVDTIKDIQDASIIVAANEMYSSEIENTLKLLGCEEVYVITKEEYKTFRRIAPDIFPEIRQEMLLVILIM